MLQSFVGKVHEGREEADGTLLAALAFIRFTQNIHIWKKIYNLFENELDKHLKGYLIDKIYV